MRKHIKTSLIVIVLSGFIGEAYAFTAKDINPLFRDYLFFGGMFAWIISIITLGILVISAYISDSKPRKTPSPEQ